LLRTFKEPHTCLFLECFDQEPGTLVQQFLKAALYTGIPDAAARGARNQVARHRSAANASVARDVGKVISGALLTDTLILASDQVTNVQNAIALLSIHLMTE
jgi:hypothetical protein